MPISSLFLRSAPLAALAVLSFMDSTTHASSAPYQLVSSFTGDSFFTYFDFAGSDSSGFVTYDNYNVALDDGLIAIDGAGTSFVGVDSSTVLNPHGPGREAIKLVSTNSYTHGLFIVDLSNMPNGVCGIDSKFSLAGSDLSSGQIDIISGLINQPYDLTSLFTESTCSIAGDGQTGTTQSTACSSTSGCGVLDDSDSNSFGSGFNNNNGGVYATLWTSDFIRVWFFDAGSTPDDITAETPTPELWGEPLSNFEGACSIDDNFSALSIVFDTDFCTPLVEASWASSPYCSSQAPTCADFVGLNPDAFSEMYWAINSVKVYQTPAAAASTSTSISSSAAATSTSTTAATTSSSAAATSTSISAAAATSSSASSVAASTTSASAAPSSTSSAAPSSASSLSYSYYGCVEEGLTQRILYDSHSLIPGMIMEDCEAACAGYTYFGVEYGDECYCGNSFTEVPIIAPDSDCWMPCSGSITQICGGPDRLSVYSISLVGSGATSSSSSSSIAAASSTLATSAAPSSSAAASSTAVASSSSSAAPSSAAASSLTSSIDPPTAASSSTYAAASSTTSSSIVPSSTCVRLGCYTESGATTSFRTLNDFHYINYDNMSPDICAAQCPEYSYYGVEYSGECYCGNVINQPSSLVLDSQCAMPCGGNPSEFCGAGNRIDIYSCVGPSSSSSSAAASSSTSIADPPASSSAAASSFSVAASSSTSITDPSASSSAAASSSSSDPPPFAAASSSTSTAASSSTSSTRYHHHHHHSTSSSSILADPTSVANPQASSSADPPLSSSSSLDPPLYSSSSISPPPSTSALDPSYTTSTIYATTVYTVTSCAATVTDCPARIGQLTTDIVTLYTTFCPYTDTTTPTPSPSPSPAPKFTTSTVYTTTVYTITSCAATVTDCPARIGQVTTETIALYTTVCPVTANQSPIPVAAGTPGSVGPAVTPSTPLVTLSTSLKVAGSTVTPLQTANNVAAPVYPASNGTSSVNTKLSTGRGGAKSTVTVLPVPAASSPLSVSGAGRFKVSIWAGVAFVGVLGLL